MRSGEQGIAAAREARLGLRRSFEPIKGFAGNVIRALHAKEWQQTLEGQAAELKRRSDAVEERAQAVSTGQAEVRQNREALEQERRYSDDVDK